MSSLAAQLAQNASLNAAILVDRSRRKAAESYLFTGREADQHDLESIYALGVNGLLQLASLNSALRKFEDQLFSEYAKSMDRTLLPLEANAELDAGISAFLALLGPYLMEAPTGKVLEWLVRRFRINEFNVESILSLFLPYHESPHFTKMISILHIKQNSTWSFLLPFKSAAQNLSRMALVTEMLRNSDVSRFVTSLLPSALKEGRPHRVLLAFNAACLHDFISRSQALDEGTVAYLLPALLVPLQQDLMVKDAILGSYVLLSALSQKCHISPAALSAVMGTMTTCAKQVDTKQYINALLAFCEPQDELECFSDRTIKAMLRISDIDEELRNASLWIGVEKILNPLLPGLIKRLDDERATSLLESILTAPKVPQIVVQRSALRLVGCAVVTDASPAVTSARRLLAIVQQRHPTAFQEAMDAISLEEDVEQETVDQLRISLTVVPRTQHTDSKRAGSVDVVLASTNADPGVRTAAVNQWLMKLSRDSLASDEMESIHSALVARVQDTNQAVIDALYSHPQTLLPVFREAARTYIDRLSGVLSAPGAKPKRSLVRAHLTFLATHFCPANMSHMDSVFQRIMFPFLLFSKPRQHTAEVVWDIISSQKDSEVHEWLAGCAAIVAAEQGKDVSDGVGKIGSMNILVASQIARNILKSNHYSEHLDTLIAKLQDPNPHVKVLGYLITSALLRQLSGEHQVEAAHRVLDVISIEALAGMQDLPQTSDSSEVTDDMTLAKAVVAKPSSRSTLQRLQMAVVAFVPSIERPTGLVLDWVAGPSYSTSDNRGSRFVELIRRIYRLANFSSSVPVFTTNVLQTLFINLKGDAFAFLAGIWVSADGSQQDELPTVALRHAAAFLQAHAAEGDGVDFQTILPSLLVALHSRVADRRQAATVCISHMCELATRPFKTVYGFDTIYGKSENQLQYLDRDDLKKYVDALAEHQDHLVHDVDYINVFHQRHLGRSKGDKKRDSEYKHRVLCFITSHINAIALPAAQVALLKSVDAISDSAKAQILLPTIKTLVSSMKADSTNDMQSLVELAISCFDASVVKDLNEEGELWGVFISLIRASFTSAGPPVSRVVISRALERGLFPALSAERQITLVELLLDLGAQNAEIYAASKQVLGDLVEDVRLIVHILDSLQPASTTGVPRATKRMKTTGTSEDALSRLTLFVEVLGTRSLPGSLDLISHLLETLNRVLQSQSAAQGDVSYVEQLLMSAIENVANKVMEIPNLSPSVVRLDILVDLIRVADNPQTFHQALLLVANLARLAPDSVLHNVMPVFTFMGSNVFHRDDSYSFKVVQQTVDSIVPVMVSSLKRTHTEALDLYIGSRDFLRVFTDAANHVPRHRRTNFFAHLIDILGSEDFLPPVCMLLVEKAANRVVRQSAEEVQGSLSLPMSVLQHVSLSLQIRTLTSILRESQRLADRIIHPNMIQPTFLEVPADEEPASASATTLRRRAQALIIFVGNALKAPTPGSTASEEELSQLVAALISLATLDTGTIAEGKGGEICQAARATLNRALSVMAATDFVNGILSMMQSGDVLVQAGALDLLSERLPQVSEKTRRAVVPVIRKIIGAIVDLLTSSQANDTLTSAAFKALRYIGLSLCAGEESTVAETIPLILASIKGRKAAGPAMSALSPLPTKIGPRIIPYFREIISESVSIIREGTAGTLEDTYGVLLGLLTSIPTFWGRGELTQAVTVYVDHYASTSSSPPSVMLSLMKAIAKRAPADVLLPALIDMWPSVKVSPQAERFVAYFDVLARALRSAARPAVLEQLRSLFKVFLECFDLVKDSVADAQTQAIIAFQEVVVKLNEAAFRPLFRRLYDWAFAASTDDAARKITFCHVYIALLDFFKGLMNPYMSFLLSPIVECLKSFSAGSADNHALWVGVIQVLTKSLTYDDGAFWRDDKLRQMTSPLIQQVAVCVKLSTAEGKSLFQDCLVALVESVTDDMLLKSINLGILMHTRSEDVRSRLFALACSEKLWRVHGGKLLGFVAETTTFIAECAEDENDMVVRESVRLKDAVESVAGNISGL
ncbi:putative U3 small nucleolar RNA-associated protein 10 [Lyophyllum shimeji]|uniref:U3 small nucleolar RNA-associated protein 10 n=1 Tax=Lyophyllum shimeji TaxID=47721 RepID=A0A9P3PZ55_LYOSH|nr:putative U3 small nucleolar RNA-associated protein 10 [Lyophyllum shimeji]